MKLVQVVNWKLSFGIIAMLMLSISCNPEDDHLKLYKGEITAERNGNCWNAHSFAVDSKFSNEKVDIQIGRFNEQGFAREDLYFFKIPKEVGTYELSPTEVRTDDELIGASYRSLVDDGDVLGDIFNLYMKAENYIELTRVKGKKLEGHFQVAFIRDTTFADADPTVPDTVIFTQGKFETKIIR